MPSVWHVPTREMFQESQSSSELINNLQSMLQSDVVITIPHTHYKEESRSYPGKYTALVYFTEQFGAQPILGSILLMGHDVNFDIGRGMTGFAESHCDHSRYVEERDAKQQQELLRQEEEIISRVA